jgi:hypothetical protein
MRTLITALPLLLALSAAAQPTGTETNCTDRVDNDGDSVMDCADADCYENDACKSGGGLENSNQLCSDFVDNDGDGYTDCDDRDCQTQSITVCAGSWEGPLSGTGVKPKSTGGGDATPTDTIPELGEGMTVEDLIGKGDDADGERSDQLCSDGFDNDQDGMTDCADIGCRFDPNVTVCRGAPNLRFSIVAHVTSSYETTNDHAQDDPIGLEPNEGREFAAIADGQLDTRFSVLQLRAFGPLPGIQDSFFLVSVRAETAPRLTFAMASFPIGGGHFVNINSGGGGISNALILSAAKRPLIDAPFYVYSAFEQGNGAALEVSGPIIPGKLDYRSYVAGGSGFFNGNVGGRFFTFDNENFTYSLGGQLTFAALGYVSRWDSGYMYTEVPTALSFGLGAKYDQRAQEIYPALNANMIFRSGRFMATAETYMKRELAFVSNQVSYNVMGGVLLWPKKLMFAMDFGQFLAGDMEKPPDVFQTDLRRQRNETQWRAALHWYVWKNVGVLSLAFADRYLGAGVQEIANGEDVNIENERTIKAVAQFRF